MRPLCPRESECGWRTLIYINTAISHADGAPPARSCLGTASQARAGFLEKHLYLTSLHFLTSVVCIGSKCLRIVRKCRIVRCNVQCFVKRGKRCVSKKIVSRLFRRILAAYKFYRREPSFVLCVLIGVWKFSIGKP